MSKQQDAALEMLKYGKDKLGPAAYIPANAKTGTWRLLSPIPDNIICIRCGICRQYCPCAVIEVDEKGCSIDYVYCKGCGICVNICPKKAIKMFPEKADREVD